MTSDTPPRLPQEVVCSDSVRQEWLKQEYLGQVRWSLEMALEELGEERGNWGGWIVTPLDGFPPSQRDVSTSSNTYFWTKGVLSVGPWLSRDKSGLQR